MDQHSFGVMLSTVDTGWCSLFMTLLRSLGSSQVLNLPLGFSQITSALTQGEGPLTGVIIPCSTISSNFLSKLACNAKGIFLGR